jgi:hypothetical protein
LSERSEASGPPPPEVLEVAGWATRRPRTVFAGCRRLTGWERSIEAGTAVVPKASEAFAAGKENGPMSAPNTRSQR